MASPASSASPAVAAAIQRRVWAGRIPLEIRLSPAESLLFDQGDPYIIAFPRVAYLPLLLPRLLAFFSSELIDPLRAVAHKGWFSWHGRPLNWHQPVGLLYDMLAGAHAQDDDVDRFSDGDADDASHDGHQGRRRRLPWRLVVHFTDFPAKELVRLDEAGKVLADAYMNSVKEADFLRNGTARNIMALSKEHSAGLWEAVAASDLAAFQRIFNILSPPSQPLRHVPLRVFVSQHPPPPSAPISTDKGSAKEVETAAAKAADESRTLRPLQALFTPQADDGSDSHSEAGSGSKPRTLGAALHSLVPSLFPSKRVTAHARAVLHGAPVPLSAPLEELLRCAAYPDGWLHVVVDLTA
ncbi:autophagy protein 5 [Ascosphaera acerosa]|nr:autophagy protein 5 [Ascosphaera acerosa]